MHSPLDAHLHTPECNEIIKKLIECHAQNSKFKQAFGVCTDIDMEMRKCTRNERLGRVKENIETSRDRNKATQEKLKKLQAEGKSWRDILDDKPEQK